MLIEVLINGFKNIRFDFHLTVGHMEVKSAKWSGTKPGVPKVNIYWSITLPEDD